jgi:ABC-2 type transport system permease protein
MPGPSPAPVPAEARILDRGYRRYEGPRLGAAGAQRALYVASIQRALGLRRRFRYKVVPLLVAVMTYLPAAVFVGVAALIPGEVATDLVPRYGDYYGFVTAAMLLFVAAVVPDVMCTDRQTGMLGLYLAAPLTRDTYLAMKAAAVVSVIAVVTLGPPILLLVGYSFVDLGPGWPTEGLLLAVRIVGAGLAVALWYTGIALVASALTARRAVASAGIVLVTLVSSAVVGGLVEGAELTPWLHLADVYNLPFEVVRRIYGEPGSFPELSTLPLFAFFIGALVAMGVIVRTRYQRLTVTK